jgi:hypothetical protein
MVTKGLCCNILKLGYWRAIGCTVRKLVQMIEEAIVAYNPSTIVLQLLDSSMFYALQEDGTNIPERNLNGHYHVDGELVVADKRAQEKLLALCKPLFETAAGRKLVVISPLPRYVTGPCCADELHMPNRRRRTFLEETLADLDTFKKGLKDVLFSNNIRYGRVMDQPQAPLQ